MQERSKRKQDEAKRIHDNHTREEDKLQEKGGEKSYYLDNQIPQFLPSLHSYPLLIFLCLLFVLHILHNILMSTIH